MTISKSFDASTNRSKLQDTVILKRLSD